MKAYDSDEDVRNSVLALSWQYEGGRGGSCHEMSWIVDGHCGWMEQTWTLT